MEALEKSSVVESNLMRTLMYIVPFRGREQKFWKYLLTAMKDWPNLLGSCKMSPFRT